VSLILTTVNQLQSRDIIVIGGSAGGIESLKAIVRGLPANFAASILVVIHQTPDYPSALPHLVSRWGGLPSTQAVDQEHLRPGHIFISRPDHHLTIEGHRIRVQRGPRENRHRPAIDPLFRTAAREYGERVVGVILSGRQDDGSAGLYSVKQRGGIAIVQDPQDAAAREMPLHALEYANPQYVLQAREIAPVLIKLLHDDHDETAMTQKNTAKNGGKRSGKNPEKKNGSKAGKPDANIEVSYASEGEGSPSVFACPECHGVLWELKKDKLTLYRCRVGHSYSTDSLRTELSQASESALWAAVRALEEKAAMQRRIADRLSNERNLARRLRDQSTADDGNARLIREMIFTDGAELEKEEYEEGVVKEIA
jgi:two-component system, chemotaxis family, protein-glutamate methylesterase/glutaminase